MPASDALARVPIRERALDRDGPAAHCSPPRDGDGPGPEPARLFGDPARFGLWLFLGTVTMLFVGFSSAYIVRRTAADWRELPVPRVLWLGTALLLASSAAVEAARRTLRSRGPAPARPWLLAGGALGGLFVAAQWFTWRTLAAEGLYLASNPHSSFFYLLSGLHAVHLLGGLAWFTGVLLQSERGVPDRGRLGRFATYWHFLSLLWIYLFWLLFAS